MSSGDGNDGVRKWRIERLRCQAIWTWIAVGPDRVLRYFTTHAEALAEALGYATANDTTTT